MLNKDALFLMKIFNRKSAQRKKQRPISSFHAEFRQLTMHA